MTDSELLDLISRLNNFDEVHGVLVYGSHATGGADLRSDIDIILVTGGTRATQFITHLEGADLDVYSAPVSVLGKALETDNRTNNNFLLYAFSHGRSLLDRNGDVQQLLANGQRIWANGPVAPTREEQSQLRGAVVKSVYAATRLSARATQSLEWQAIAQMQCGFLFMQCVYSYCRVNRLWSSAIWEMLKWTDGRYEGLLAMSRSYLNGSTPDQRLSALRDLGDAITSIIDSDLHQTRPF
jgi:predicted nucleotidyltransferase